MSAKAGVPQSHISKIENGGSDIRLSSLIELARALELELVLVPRRLVPAVQGVLRSVPAQSMAAHEMYREVADALKVLARLAAAHPDVKALELLQQTVRLLNDFRLSPLDLNRIKMTIVTLSNTDLRDDDMKVVAAVRILSHLQIQLAHAAPSAPRSAYALDDDNDA